MLGLAARSNIRTTAPRALQRQLLFRRQIGTTPPAHRPRTWKSSAARWGLAGAGIWYYNTHDFWADTGFDRDTLLTVENEPAILEVPTLESLAASRKQRLATASAPPTMDIGSQTTASYRDSEVASAAALSSAYPPSDSSSSSATSTSTLSALSAPTSASAPTSESGAEELEDEAASEGAFNPETGEINWDCPCLGGMAHGPCGEQFRDAFSCFVYSEQEPKGIDCIDKFKHMQDCFRLHPDVYGNELTGDEDDEALEGEMGAAGEGVPAGAAANTAVPDASPVPPAQAPYSGEAGLASSAPGANLTSTPAAAPSGLSGSTGISEGARSKQDSDARKTERAKTATRQVASEQGSPMDESERLVPKSSQDTRGREEGRYVKET